MDPALASILELVFKNGVQGLLLVILYFFTKHHLNVLKKHQEVIDALKKEHQEAASNAAVENRELEKELREKIEELLKDQLETQKPLTEALVEYNRLIKRLKPGDDR